MNFIEYQNNLFLNDLRKIPYRNDILRHEREPSQVFGDIRWGKEQIKIDLQNIDSANMEYFILCLFTIVTIDQNMHANFKRYYPIFRSSTMYPKFAAKDWKDVQAPKWILYRAYTEKYTDFAWTKANIGNYVDDLILQASNYFHKLHIPISSKIFFNKMVNDEGFSINEDEKGTVFELIRNTLVEKLSTM